MLADLWQIVSQDRLKELEGDSMNVREGYGVQGLPSMMRTVHFVKYNPSVDPLIKEQQCLHDWLRLNWF